MRSFGITDTGIVRRRNEDDLYVDGTLLAVADGMGGHQAGDVASSTAIALLKDSSGNERLKDPEKFLRSVIARANSEILMRSTSEETLHGMGTTVVAGVVSENHMTIGHVGDSRAYLLRDGELRQLTEDHSLVEEMVRAGQISGDEAKHHPHRSIITRALGVEATVEIDIIHQDILPADKFLFCSDGLTGVVEDADIASAMTGSDGLEEIGRRLIEMAKSGGGPDNITVVLAESELKDTP